MEREGERQREKGRDKAQGGGGGGGERQRQRPNNRACLTSLTPLLPQAVQLIFYGTKADLVVQFLGERGCLLHHQHPAEVLSTCSLV